MNKSIQLTLASTFLHFDFSIKSNTDQQRNNNNNNNKTKRGSEESGKLTHPQT